MGAFRGIQLLQCLVEKPLRLGLQDIFLGLGDSGTLGDGLAEGGAVFEGEATLHQGSTPRHPDAASTAGAAVAFVHQHQVIAFKGLSRNRLVAHLIGQLRDLDHIHPTLEQRTGLIFIKCMGVDARLMEFFQMLAR